MPKFETLVDPNDVEWTPSTAIEDNDLRAQGYRVKGADAPTADAPKPTASRTPLQ